MQEHDGEEFAGFGEDVGDVVNVTETGVAEGRGEGLSDRDKQETEGDGEGGEDAGGGVGRGVGVAEVDVAGEGGEEGLDRVEDEGSAEDDFVGAIGGGGDALLEEGPCQTVLGEWLAESEGEGGEEGDGRKRERRKKRRRRGGIEDTEQRGRDKRYAQRGVDAADADHELEDGAAVVLGFLGGVGD